ncbi:hypothetical protein K439DRAFT_1352584 [Ramaria rubella]|nr:hypothetical protein K439DRAFT_1352584 [Ramaria rubella]
MARIVDEVTTLRCHIEANHKVSYEKWVRETPGAENKLPKHLKQLKVDVKRSNELPQSSLTDHFGSAPPTEVIIPYSDERFKQAATEWLIATDQPIPAFEHPKFIEMVNIATRAKNGVKVPTGKATHKGIMSLWQHLHDVKACINVSPLQCNASGIQHYLWFPEPRGQGIRVHNV